VSGRGECVCEAIGPPSMFRLIRRAGVLGEDDANFRFELGTESSAVETELVLVVLCMLKSPAHDLMCVLMGGKKIHGFGNQFGVASSQVRGKWDRWAGWHEWGK
jgi:hypothetical protein